MHELRGQLSLKDFRRAKDSIIHSLHLEERQHAARLLQQRQVYSEMCSKLKIMQVEERTEAARVKAERVASETEALKRLTNSALKASEAVLDLQEKHRKYEAELSMRLIDGRQALLSEAHT